MTPAKDREKDRKLVIVGDSAFAEIAGEYFACDSRYEVAAFAVEQAYLQREELMGRPVVALETLPERYPRETHDVYVAIVYSQLNRLRTRLMCTARAAGYALASYVSPRAFVWRNVQLGEHCFIFEDNVVQPFVTIGDNVVLWSGNHIGHHSRIGNNVFFSSHRSTVGLLRGRRQLLPGASTPSVGNNVKIGKDCWIGPGVVLAKDTKEGEIYRAPELQVTKVGALRFFKVKD